MSRGTYVNWQAAVSEARADLRRALDEFSIAYATPKRVFLEGKGTLARKRLLDKLRRRVKAAKAKLKNLGGSL